MHFVICPYSKPEYGSNLVESLQRQTFRGFTPIVVENGPAIGSFPGLEGAVVIQSEAHQSLAKNRAMEWIRQRGDGSWSVFDCDDYYGPGYLEHHLEALQEADIVGKSFWNMMYLKYDDGIYLNGVGQQDPARSITGGALSCRTAHVLDYPVLSVGEDGSWFWRMTQKGARVLHTGAKHYCYNRAGSGHTWQPDQKTEKLLKKGMRFLGDLPVETANRSPRDVLVGSERISRLIMLHTPDYTPAQASVPDIKRYCRIWDLPLTVYPDKIEPSWPAAWSKILACSQALQMTPPNEWVMWMDADMVLRRHNAPLEELIDPTKDFMISVDHNGICTGLFLIRNTPLMQEFFAEMLKDIRMEWPWEQDAMKDLLRRRPDFAARVGHIPEAQVQNPSSGRNSGALVMHYWGNSYPNRDLLLQRMQRDIWSRDAGRSRGRLFSS